MRFDRRTSRGRHRLPGAAALLLILVACAGGGGAERWIAGQNRRAQLIVTSGGQVGLNFYGADDQFQVSACVRGGRGLVDTATSGK